MILLTPFVTVVRVGSVDGNIVQARVWPIPPDQRDVILDVPATVDTPVSIPGMAGFTMEPGARAGLVRITRGNEILCFDPHVAKPFLRHRGAATFEFLLATAADLTALRDLFAHRWVAGEGDNRREMTPVAAAAFQLDLGGFQVDLSRRMPRAVPSPDPAQATYRLEIGGQAGSCSLVRTGVAREEILLQRAPADRRPATLREAAAFAATRDAMLALPGPEEILTVPMTVCDADHAWLYDKPEGNQDQRVGRHRFCPLLARAADKFVLLARHVEGMIFDSQGVYTEFGYANGLGTGGSRHLPMPPGMRQEGERLFVDRAVLAAMPRLKGPHVVFYGGTLSNYTHWLIDGMLPLHVLLPHVPPGARLLLPATLRRFGDAPAKVCDHHDIMRAFGYAGLPAIEIDAPYCFVEQVYWLENGWIQNMPAAHVQALRAHVASLRPPPGRHNLRLYIARRQTRRVANQAELEAFLRARGFDTHNLENLSVDQQIDLFAQAEWVVAPHGAELGNLLFCRPGTKVLELAPDSGFKPYYSYICNKLGLSHGILPCPTHDGGFFGDMTVDLEKFVALFRMLKQRM